MKPGCCGVAIFHLPIILKAEKASLKREKIEADVDKKAAWVTHGFSSGEFCSFVFCEILLYPNIVFFFWLKLPKADFRYRQPKNPKEHSGIYQILMT